MIIVRPVPPNRLPTKECHICYESSNQDFLGHRIKKDQSVDDIWHSYCPKCTDTWMKITKTCPICREPIVLVATSVDEVREAIFNMHHQEKVDERLLSELLHTGFKLLEQESPKEEMIDRIRRIGCHNLRLIAGIALGVKFAVVWQIVEDIFTPNLAFSLFTKVISNCLLLYSLKKTSPITSRLISETTALGLVTGCLVQRANICEGSLSSVFRISAYIELIFSGVLFAIYSRGFSSRNFKSLLSSHPITLLALTAIIKHQLATTLDLTSFEIES